MKKSMQYLFALFLLLCLCAACHPVEPERFMDLSQTVTVTAACHPAYMERYTEMPQELRDILTAVDKQIAAAEEPMQDIDISAANVGETQLHMTLEQVDGTLYMVDIYVSSTEEGILRCITQSTDDVQTEVGAFTFRDPTLIAQVREMCAELDGGDAPETIAETQPETDTIASPETAETEETSPFPTLSFDSVLFTPEANPELDFGTWEHDGRYMIRDFTVSPQNTILIWQMSGVLCEYDFSGKLLGQYDYSLSDRGMTAFRVAAGQNGEVFFLDGHNNCILTGTTSQAEIRNSSRVLWNDVALAGRYFGLDSAGNLCLSELHPTESTDGNMGVGYTHSLDVSGEEAVIVRTRYGYAISEDCTFQIDKHDETVGTREIFAKIYIDGVWSQTVTVSTTRETGLPIEGMTLLGRVGTKYLFEVVEVFDGSEKEGVYFTVESTYVLVDMETGDWQACVCTIDDSNMTRICGDQTYCLRRTDDGVRIESLEQTIGEYIDTAPFTIVVSTPTE